MPQVSAFSNGGFVVHKAYIGASPMKFSAWFDEAGKLLSAEGYTARGHARDVKPGSAAWIELERGASYYRTYLPKA